MSNTNTLLKNSAAVVKSGLLPERVIEITNAFYGDDHEPSFDEAVTNTASYEAGRQSILTEWSDAMDRFPPKNPDHAEWLEAQVAKNRILVGDDAA